uniref:Uncharacterized protein n=1 Tax=Anopheles coluzzii TaxID=1518534 RepID=A0A8W7PI52_ANOCL
MTTLAIFLKKVNIKFKCFLRIGFLLLDILRSVLRHCTCSSIASRIATYHAWLSSPSPSALKIVPSPLHVSLKLPRNSSTILHFFSGNTQLQAMLDPSVSKTSTSFSTRQYMNMSDMRMQYLRDVDPSVLSLRRKPSFRILRPGLTSLSDLFVSAFWTTINRCVFS